MSFANYATISEAGTPRKLIVVAGSYVAQMWETWFHIGMTYHFLLVSEFSNSSMVSARPNTLVVTSATVADEIALTRFQTVWSSD